MKQNILGNYTSKFMLFFVMCAVALLSSCDKKDITRATLEAELEQESKDYPVEIVGKDFMLEGIKIDGDYLRIDYSIAEAKKEEYLTLSKDFITSEQNIARVMEGFDKQVKDALVSAELGMKLVYKIKETGKVAIDVDITPEQLRSVVDKLASGEIKASSTLDAFRAEIDAMKLPVKVDEVTVMKNVEIRGNDVHYIMEISLDDVEFEADQAAEMKKMMIENLSGTAIVLQKQNMIRENIHIIYDYVDKNGNELVSIDIAPIELKAPEKQ